MKMDMAIGNIYIYIYYRSQSSYAVLLKRSQIFSVIITINCNLSVRPYHRLAAIEQ